VDPKFGDLIENLIATTTRVIIAHPSRALASPKAQKVQLPMSPVLLAWSVSQRASHDVIIRATIEHVTTFFIDEVISSDTAPQGRAK
jgi:hypothetical protein